MQEYMNQKKKKKKKRNGKYRNKPEAIYELTIC